MWWMNCNNGFSIHFTYHQLIFICETVVYIDWWIMGGDCQNAFASTVVKNCNHFIKSFKAYNHLKQDMAAYGTFLHVYIFKGKLLKEGYHFPIISRLIICRVFQLRWIANICCLYLVRIINRSFYYVLYVFTVIRHIILQLNYKDATIKPLKMYRYSVN